MKGRIMSKATENENIVWTPQMPDRRKNDRRDKVRDFHTNGKSLNISDMKDRRDNSPVEL